MNLKAMMKDASLQNLQWLVNEANFAKSGDTYVPKDKDTDKKDDLQVEWGYGNVGMDYTSKNIPQPGKSRAMAELEAQKTVVRFAKNLMMSGYMGKRLFSALKQQFGTDGIQCAKSGLKKLLKNEGILGCLAFECDAGKSSTSQLMAAAKNSPFKESIRFVIPCKSCVGCIFHESRAIASKPKKVSSSSIDTFLSSGESKVIRAPFCGRHGRYVLSGRSELDPARVDHSYMDVVVDSDGPRPEDKIKTDRIENMRKGFIRAHDEMFASNKVKISMADAKRIVDSQKVEATEMKFEIPKKVKVKEQQVNSIASVLDKVAVEKEVPKSPKVSFSRSDKDSDVPVDPSPKVLGRQKVAFPHSKTQDVQVASKPKGQRVAFYRSEKMADVPVDPKPKALESPKVAFPSEKYDIRIGSKQKSQNVEYPHSKTRDLSVASKPNTPKIVFHHSKDSDVNFDPQPKTVKIAASKLVSKVLSDVELNPKSAKDIDIDASVFVDKEFEGSDKFELDTKKARKQLDVNMKSDFTF